MDPSSVPIAEVIVDSDDLHVSEFKIGNDDDWIVEWRNISDDDGAIISIDCDIGIEVPNFISRSRNGWYINPDPLHNISRRLIFPTVSLLIISLFIHAIEPGLVEQGIINSTIAGSISIGPLEYPRLLFFTFPIFLLPLLFRTIANFRDMSRQSIINTNPYGYPDIDLDVNREVATASINSIPKGLSIKRARIQVGVAVPERSTVLESLGRFEGRQPSPGMSTKLPDRRVATGDDVGIGVGESTPMQLSSRRSVILEPMRIMDVGDWANEKQDIVTLRCPINWPGTIYSSLIAIHWEAIFEFQDQDGMTIKWVTPLFMPQSDDKTTIEVAPVRSGRAELSNY